MTRRWRKMETDAPLLSLLKSCAIKKDLHEGARIHAELLLRSDCALSELNPYIVTCLINMYAKCGQFAVARKLLEQDSIQNVSSWNALISGYAQQGEVHEALDCFACMQRENVSPNSVTFVCILKACGSKRALGEGRKVHKMIVNSGLLDKHIVLATALVDMYAKCGIMTKAKQVLDSLSARDVVSWNALISGYIQAGQCHEALDCMQRIYNECLSLNSVTFICILKACATIGAINKGKQIHERILNRGLLEKDLVLGNALIDMYARCGMVSQAREVLEDLPTRDVVSWNTLICGYVQYAQNQEALYSFDRMQSEGLTPDVVTFMCILKACGNIGAIDKGKQIHEDILKAGFLAKDVMLVAAVVDMYAKCGALAKAKEVVDGLEVRNSVCWNALISGYSRKGLYNETLSCYESMQSDGFTPDLVTFVCILKACGSRGDLRKGEQIHHEIQSRSLLDNECVLGNALVDMYAKCGELGKAQEVLESLPTRNIVSWSTLIGGYAQQGQCHDALDCLERMQTEGLVPNAITFICILKACMAAGAIDKGKQIHGDVVRRGFLKKDLVLGTTLVDMYARCGMLAKAQELLEDLPIRDVASWNALMAGYAQHGRSHSTLDAFKMMIIEGICPDEVTLLCMLNACSHSGAWYETQNLVAELSTQYGINLTIEHHTSMVVGFGCMGHFDKAVSVIEAMPSDMHVASIWLALLGTCQKWSNVKLALSIFDQVVQVNDSLAAGYILMANIFAAAGMTEDAGKLQALMILNNM